MKPPRYRRVRRGDSHTPRTARRPNAIQWRRPVQNLWLQVMVSWAGRGPEAMLEEWIRRVMAPAVAKLQSDIDASNETWARLRDESDAGWAQYVGASR